MLPLKIATMVCAARDRENLLAPPKSRGNVVPVQRRIQVILVFAAWFMATGSQWDFLQVFAWGKMIYDSSQDMPVAEAVCTTFTPGSTCSLCRAVDQAKRSTDAFPIRRMEHRIVLFFQPMAGPVIDAPVPAEWLPGNPGILAAGRAAPLLRPPRFGAA